MSFLLMVCLTLVCLPSQYPSPWLPVTAGQSAGFAFLYIAVIGLHAFWVSSKVSWAARPRPARGTACSRATSAAGSCIKSSSSGSTS